MTVTAQDLAVATRRSAIALAIDPQMRHYSAETLALVHERTILNMADAGDLLKVAERMANDPELQDVPIGAVEEIMAASFRLFTKALGGGGQS
jgi:hypothetical protein